MGLRFRMGIFRFVEFLLWGFTVSGFRGFGFKSFLGFGLNSDRLGLGFGLILTSLRLCGD